MSAVANISKHDIKERWAEKLIELGKFDSKEEIMENDYCFACGMESNTEKAHIEARSKGGNDDIDNLHLLCHTCHNESELKKGEEYWQWIKDKKFFDLINLGFSGPFDIKVKHIEYPKEWSCPVCHNKSLSFNKDHDIYCEECDMKIDPEMELQEK